MHNALKQLRKQRILLDRAIRALEELETLQSRRAHDPRDLNPSKSSGDTMPGGVIIFPGGASRAKLARSRKTASEPARRTGSGRDATNG
jgi:hypothetical protein